MKKVDYIIVGCGLASIAFVEQLIKHQKSFVVFDDASQQSSIVAAGLYNPVILKRFSEVWKAQEQLDLALPLYETIEKRLNVKLNYKWPLLRKFTSIEEQNQWFNAADKPNLEPFLSLKLIKNTNPHINAPFGFGEVLSAGRIDTKQLISSYKKSLRAIDTIQEESFVFNDLKLEKNEISYNDYAAKQIVFAEGFGVKKNPYFKTIPLNGTKGEVLTIKAPNLKLESAIKSSVFVVPIGNDLYKVGATYNWTDKSNTPTKEGKDELISKLKTLIHCDFEVTNHIAGIRPTVKDRRPLIGRHHTYKNLYVLNGLGTRGVMIAPYVAEKLFNLIEHNQPIDREIDVNRFSEN